MDYVIGLVTLEYLSESQGELSLFLRKSVSSSGAADLDFSSSYRAPGSGKSTLAYPLVDYLNAKLLCGETGKRVSEEEAVAVAVGLDGWHHSRAELDAFPVRYTLLPRSKQELTSLLRRIRLKLVVEEEQHSPLTPFPTSASFALYVPTRSYPPSPSHSSPMLSKIQPLLLHQFSQIIESSLLKASTLYSTLNRGRKRRVSWM